MTIPTSTISADIPDHLRAKIEEAATWKGMSIGTFIADVAANEAEQVIERERLIQLSREDSERIPSLLDNPPQPNAALQKAAELHERLLDG